MALTSVTMKVRKFEDSDQSFEAGFVVDSGMRLSLASGRLLTRIGVPPAAETSLVLLSGQRVTRSVANAYFGLGGDGAYSRVVFGEEGDCNLLGALTLAELGLMLDPLKRELKPLPMLLM